MKKKILVIDDDKDLSELVKSALESQGFQASVLNSGKYAVKLIKKEMPDLILLDIRLPDKDGYQICDEIKSTDETKQIPVIVFTGEDTERTLLEDIHNFYGANDCLKKPFELDDLYAKVKKLLAEKKK